MIREFVHINADGRARRDRPAHGPQDRQHRLAVAREMWLSGESDALGHHLWESTVDVREVGRG